MSTHSGIAKIVAIALLAGGVSAGALMLASAQTPAPPAAPAALL